MLQHYETVQVVIQDHQMHLAGDKQANAAEQHLLNTAQLSDRESSARRAHSYATPSARSHSRARSSGQAPPKEIPAEISSELLGVTAVRKVG